MTTGRGLLRRQRAAYMALALLIAVGGGVAIGASIAAYRTDRAYPEFVNRSKIADLVINPSLSTLAMDQAVRGFDGVRSVHTNALMLAGFGEIHEAVLSDLLTVDPFLQVLGSPDGRFVDVDRPAVTSGRVPSGDHEVFVTEGFRAQLEAELGHPVAVGDTVSMSFLWAGISLQTDLTTVITPIGIESLTISGFGYLPDEVLPDELFPRQRVIVSGDIARKYDCVSDLHADMSLEEAVNAYVPPNCSTLYRYYSLDLTTDPNAVDSISRQFATAATELSADLPQALLDQGAGYYLIPQNYLLIYAIKSSNRSTAMCLPIIFLLASNT